MLIVQSFTMKQQYIIFIQSKTKTLFWHNEQLINIASGASGAG